MKLFYRFLILILTAGLFFLLDILFKNLTENQSYTLVEGKINVEYTQNYGIAFSLFSDAGIWLVAVTCALTAFAFFAWWFFGRKSLFATFAFALFIAGAAGNLFDRVMLGYVRDFIALPFLNFDFPVFNVADICLNIGVAMLILYFLFTGLFHKKAKK
jgi:signal peptidase II